MTPVVEPVVDIVIKSYPPDYGFLSYCLRSIHKFASGFNDVIILLPSSYPLPLTAEKVVLLDVPESYMSQQVAKLNADLHTQASHILHFDSDMLFTDPVTPGFFFKDGKPVWVITPFDEAEDDEKRAWLHVMVKCLREMPKFEFMRKCAIIVPRWLYAEFRSFIEKTHGMTMEAYVMSQPGHEFSEYNCLGFYAWIYHRDAFHWHDTSVDGVPKWPFIQKWSWIKGGVENHRDEFELLLA